MELVWDRAVDFWNVWVECAQEGSISSGFVFINTCLVQSYNDIRNWKKLATKEPWNETTHLTALSADSICAKNQHVFCQLCCHFASSLGRSSAQPDQNQGISHLAPFLQLEGDIRPVWEHWCCLTTLHVARPPYEYVQQKTGKCTVKRFTAMRKTFFNVTWQPL